MHPNQPTRRDESGDFARAELVGQRPDIPVDGFVVQVRIDLKPTDGRDVDSGVQSSGQTGDHPTLAVANHAHGLLGPRSRLLRLQPIHGGQHLLDLIALHGAPHLVGRPPQHLTLRLLELARPGQSAVGVGAIDQRRNEHAASTLGQPASELIRLRHARLKTRDLLRCLVRIGDGHHGSLGLAIRNQHQTIGLHPTNDRPTHRENLETSAAAHFSRIAGR